MKTEGVDETFKDCQKLEDVKLGDLFKAYRRDCIHPGAPDFQIDEIKQAYMAGAFVMFSLLNTIYEKRTEEQAVLILDKLSNEMRDYMLQRSGLGKLQ